MKYPTVEGLHLPYLDFFRDYSATASIYTFGKKPRLAAIDQVEQCRHVIDIGAHVGISVLHWVTKFDQITAFEPMPDHFDCLVINTKSHSSVTCHNVALSNSVGSLQGAYRSMKNTGSFQLLDQHYQQPNKKPPRPTYTIEVRTLDSYTFDCVDLVKIDVEGWEFEVLQGARQTIQQHKPVLLVEFTGGNSRKSMHQYNVDQYHALIKDLGYTAVAQVEGDTVYVPRTNHLG